MARTAWILFIYVEEYTYPIGSPVWLLKSHAKVMDKTQSFGPPIITYKRIVSIKPLLEAQFIFLRTPIHVDYIQLLLLLLFLSDSAKTNSTFFEMYQKKRRREKFIANEMSCAEEW